MYNNIAYGADVLTVTASTTLGYGPNQTLPPRMVNVNPTAGVTITLPPIEASLPTPPGSPGSIPGAAGGFQITIHNQTTWATTIAPAGSDVIADPTTLNTVAGVITYISDETTNKWWKLS